MPDQSKKDPKQPKAPAETQDETRDRPVVKPAFSVPADAPPKNPKPRR